MQPKKKNGMPGHSLGYPMYHAVTGNLPVLSTQLHRPVEAAAVSSADAKVTDFQYVTGNLPVLSKELVIKKAFDDLAPGWVQLYDPFTTKVCIALHCICAS